MDYKHNVDAAIQAHSMWLVRLRLAIEQGTSEFKPEIVKTDDHCEFGKWLYHEFPVQFKNTVLFQEIQGLHAKFHQLAAQILGLAISNKQTEALKLMEPSGEFKRLSITLIGKLNELKAKL